MYLVNAAMDKIVSLSPQNEEVVLGLATAKKISKDSNALYRKSSEIVMPH